jgi:hypothetical protein
MPIICYYSNFCEPSKRLLQIIAKTKLKFELHFICIDKRYKNNQGQTVVTLENQQVLLPSVITKVPALYISDSNQVLFGDDIYSYLTPKEVQINQVATQGNGEPECFALGGRSMSDLYSFWDQGPDELSTKGNGGMRQMHNFVPIEEQFSIHTPTEDYTPDKIGNNGTKSLEQYKAERDSVVAPAIQRL